MKHSFLAILLILYMMIPARADFLGIYDNGSDSPDDSVWVYISMWDSLALKFETPDTMFIYRFDPRGDTITADTIAADSLTGLSSYNFANGFFMKRYRAGGDIGQYTVNVIGSGNGHYYSLANHCYYVNSEPLDVIPLSVIGAIANSTSELVWQTIIPPVGDTASSILSKIHSYVDGNGLGGIDADIAALNDIDSIAVFNAVLAVLKADTAIVDGGSGSYSHATLSAVSLPDSLLACATKVDSIKAWIGTPYDSSSIPTLHMKVGLGYTGHGGDNIKDDLAAFTFMGGGSEPETLVVLSSVDSTKIQGARVSVKTIDQSTFRISGLHTDINGKLIVSLDPGSFWIEVFANGFNPEFDTLVVADGGGTVMLLMDRFDPGTPPDPGLCRVYGWVYDISGDSLADIDVTAEIPREFHPVKYSNVVITPFSKSTTTDINGYWQLDLIPSLALSGGDVEYLFTVKNNQGVIYRTKTVVPLYPSWQLQE